jgi:hypothetical protein
MVVSFAAAVGVDAVAAAVAALGSAGAGCWVPDGGSFATGFPARSLGVLGGIAAVGDCVGRAAWGRVLLVSISSWEFSRFSAAGAGLAAGSPTRRRQSLQVLSCTSLSSAVSGRHAARISSKVSRVISGAACSCRMARYCSSQKVKGGRLECRVGFSSQKNGDTAGACAEVGCRSETSGAGTEAEMSSRWHVLF